MRLLFLVLSLIIFQQITAQRIQIGIAPSAGLTVFYKAESVYEKSEFKPIPKMGVGIGLPVKINLKNALFGIETGLYFQTKNYQFTSTLLDFPNLSAEGGFYSKSKIHSIQLPLILSIKQSKNQTWYLGLMVSSNTPYILTNGFDWTPNYSGTDTLLYHFVSGLNNFDRIIMPELYIGWSYSLFKNDLLTHQFRLSYEFGFAQSNKNELMVTFKNSTLIKNYQATLLPRLSTFKFSYIFYPKWLSFGNL